MTSRYHIRICIFIVLPYSLVHAHIHEIGNFLHASDMKNFPRGTYDDVKMLNFLNNDFRELEPYIFYNQGFQNLEKALLRNNNIRYIHPNAFAMMPKLSQLDLYGNGLATIHRNSFAGLESLQHLHLGSNEITYIDKDILEPLKSLQTLDLSQNFITTLKMDFVNHSHVLELDLRGNPLIFADNGAILESSSLTRLFLQSCNLTELSSNAFDMLPKLDSLDLSRNRLKVLSKSSLEKLPHLQYLDVSYNLISDINTNVFYLPTKLDVLHCNGNPLNANMDCALLLVTLHSLSLEVTPEAADDQKQIVSGDITTYKTPAFGETVKAKHRNADIYEDEGKTNYGVYLRKVNRSHNDNTKQTVDANIVVFEEKAEHRIVPSTDWNSMGVEGVMVCIIIVVSVICLILLVILLAEIYYLMKQYESYDYRRQNRTLYV